MIDYKTPDEIKTMEHGGKILSDVLYAVVKSIKPGVRELKLDEMAEKMIVERGCKPGFKRVRGYHHTICSSTNEVVVHGIPGQYALQEGDVIGVDCGVFYGGLNTDMSETVGVGKISKDAQKFLDVGKYALEEAIKVAIIGNRIGHISETIQRIVEKENGYSVVRNLIGHGVGKTLHEDPEVPGFLEGAIEDTPPLKDGMTIAIEVIYNMGKPGVVYANGDGWTIKTADNSLSGVFERTVAITKQGTVLLTP